MDVSYRLFCRHYCAGKLFHLFKVGFYGFYFFFIFYVFRKPAEKGICCLKFLFIPPLKSGLAGNSPSFNSYHNAHYG